MQGIFTQNAGNSISETPDFKIFWGSMPPDPERFLAPSALECIHTLFYHLWSHYSIYSEVGRV